MVTKASRAFAGAAMCFAIATGGVPGSAVAQELSDRSVATLMNYAWIILPSKFTDREGKIIKVDKKKKDEVVVPVDMGRAIIKVARLSAHAQICNLPNAQSANYKAMMRTEVRRKKWSEQQLLYISQLHLFTILWLTGNVEISGEDGKKNVAVKEGKQQKKPTCTDAQRANVQQRVKAYVDKVNAAK